MVGETRKKNFGGVESKYTVDDGWSNEKADFGLLLF